MDDAKELTLILKFLYERWDSIVQLMPEDQKTILRNGLDDLEKNLLETKGDDGQTLEIARDFMKVFDRIESLKFLTKINENSLRSGDFYNRPIGDLEEDVTIVLMNSLKKIKGRYK